MTAPYPLAFAPILLDKVWGGDRLARLGKPVAPGSRVGESWEVADLATTSASGAGGGAAISVIADGPLCGNTLNEAVRLWGADLLGASRPTPDGRFPLLVKYLDARENLSVQVHPSTAYALAHPEAHLKTECWYILDATPGAVIYKGVNAGVTRASFEAHLLSADGSAILSDLASVPAVIGDLHELPSGTVHALGAGVMVAEVQTPSDTTFRVFDWGRSGRQMHVAEALECIRFGPARDATRFAGASPCRLVSTDSFTVDEHRLQPGAEAPLVAAGSRRCVVFLVVAGSGEFSASNGSFAPVSARAGTTLVIPAAIAHRTLVRAEAALRALEAVIL